MKWLVKALVRTDEHIPASETEQAVMRVSTLARQFTVEAPTEFAAELAARAREPRISLVLSVRRKP